MGICENCKHEYTMGAKHCPACGAKLPPAATKNKTALVVAIVICAVLVLVMTVVAVWLALDGDSSGSSRRRSDRDTDSEGQGLWGGMQDGGENGDDEEKKLPWDTSGDQEDASRETEGTTGSGTADNREETTGDATDRPGGTTYDAHKVLPEWYASEFDKTGILLAVLVDVTRDGNPELITVSRNDYVLTGRVYYMERNGRVQQIEEITGADSHAGGFFGWYLKKTNKGYCLVQETFGMWQGYGKVDMTEYYLSPDGNRSQVDYTSAESIGEEPVTDAAMDRYIREGEGLLKNTSVLYASASEVSPSLTPLDSSMILVDNR